MCHFYMNAAMPRNVESLPRDVQEFLNRVLQMDGEATWRQGDNYPLAQVPVVRLDKDAEWELTSMQWGLLPFWWKPGKDARSTTQRTMFNARSDTVHTKPSYRDAFKKRRCLIPATEFYEGKKGHDAFFKLKDSPLMFFAGLWESCKVEDGVVESCTMLTTDANDLVAQYHPRDRMPVILPDEESRKLWMSPDIVERGPLERLFVPLSSELMSARSAA